MTTKAQRKANRKKWVAALRSGEFKQTKEVLEHDGSFCCLGVLAKLAGVQRLESGADIIYDGQIGSAGKSVREWVGLKTECGDFHDKKLGRFDDLARLNDNGKTFAEIADIIESEPEGLFED